MLKKGLLGLVFCLLLFPALSACRPENLEASGLTATPTEPITGTLRPYPTSTPTQTPLPTDYVTPTPSPTITPTATPVYYEVQQGDDMGSIGWRFKVSVEAIKTANPSVDPRAMSIGTLLLIPITPVPEPTPTEQVDFTPTPGAVELLEPDCYPDALGGLWCFVLIENQQTTALENITGFITLVWEEDIRQETALMPLNLLPAGEALPLIAYFQPPISQNFTVSAQIEFSLPVMPDDQRYLSVEIVDQTLDWQENGEIAVVSLTVLLEDDPRGAEYLWVHATAFNQLGQTVAVRRWVSPGQVLAGERLEIELTLYSLQGPIDRVAVLVEARAIEDPNNADN